MPARDHYQRNLASSVFSSPEFREIWLLETRDDRLLDIGVEMMPLGAHALGVDKTWEGNARVEITSD
jgi:hypothetical protein